MELTLYTRISCPLCEDAKLVLHDLQTEISFNLIEIDIDLSDELTEKYGMMIPVIEKDGEMIQYGIIDFFTLSERLRAK